MIKKDNNECLGEVLIQRKQVIKYEYRVICLLRKRI